MSQVIKFNEMAAPTGTITWFTIGVITPAIGHTIGGNRSDAILLSNGQYVAGGHYNHDQKVWSHDGGKWEPTHWAYINYPL